MDETVAVNMIVTSVFTPPNPRVRRSQKCPWTRAAPSVSVHATAAAGPVGRTASAETDVALRAEILSYSRARGLFAGISLAGSTLRVDNGANKNLYGKEVSGSSIVFAKSVPVPDSAKELLATLQKATPINKSGK